ncbi:flagellar motor protein MotB [Limnohabitans sp. Rim8]|uniref:flagellar motor protein MotB n=1 Tax=Limnohabitans sp. Rim8 TaxID=1100718 RepID=UPI0025E73EFA|nr:flagellar motor protein MotB [Limnohabitans sp. Rim8]
MAENNPAKAEAQAEAEAEAEAVPAKPVKPFGPDDCPKCEECPPCKAGAPGWMATFADMATLLMAFFVLLLSFAEMNVPKFKQINGSMKNAFGVQRIIPTVEPPKAQSLIAQHFTPSVAEPTPIKTIQQETTDDRKENVELKTDVAPQAQQALEATKQALAQEISRGEAQVKMEAGKVVVEMTATPSSGGGAGPSGQQKGGAGSSGSSQGGSAASGAQSAGASASGSAAGGASAAGAQAGGAAAKGAQQAGTVTQGEIEFFAKVADVQSKVQAPVEVRDVRAGATDSAGGAGKAGSAGGGSGKMDADAELQRIRQDLAKEINAGKAEVMRDGAKIIIRLAEQGSFRSGNADLQPGFMSLLGEVSKTVSSTKGRVFIEGHTDNVPVVFNERFRSNWDLSGARAGAVADYMSTQGGLGAGRLSVSGFADTKPIESNDSAAGRGRNRRIEIIIDGAG